MTHKGWHVIKSQHNQFDDIKEKKIQKHMVNTVVTGIAWAQLFKTNDVVS